MKSGKTQRSESMRRAVAECRELLADLPHSAPNGVVEPMPSLLEQVRSYLANEPSNAAPQVSVIQHFACSGGTLIARCLSAMPQVYLMSEVDPLSTHGLNLSKPVFAPTDLLRHLRYSHRTVAEDILADAYLDMLLSVARGLGRTGGRLVIRDHSHSHYCELDDPASRRSHLAILETRFRVHSIITVRDPLESYLSLKRQGWENFVPSTFDEYCRRYLMFLSDNDAAKVFKYERFVENPEAELEQMCDAIGIVYRPGAPELIPVIHLTGDSGRRGTRIAPREPKPIPKEVQQQMDGSGHYRELREKLDY